MHKNTLGYGLSKFAGFVMCMGGLVYGIASLLWILEGGGRGWIGAVCLSALAVRAGANLLTWEPPGSLATLWDLDQTATYYALEPGYFGKNGLIVLVSALGEPTPESVLALHVKDRTEPLPPCFAVERKLGKCEIISVPD